MIIIVINKIMFVANLKHQKQEFTSFNLRHNRQIYNSTLRAFFKTVIEFLGIFSGLYRFILGLPVLMSKNIGRFDKKSKPEEKF